MNSMIQIKGNQKGLYLKIDKNASFLDLMASIEDIAKESKGFYEAHKIIGVKGAEFSYAEKAQLEQSLINLLKVNVESLEVIQPVRRKKPVEPKTDELEARVRATLEKDYEAKYEQRVQQLLAHSMESSDTKFHFGTLRAGSEIRYQGNVVLIGDVNAGAQIIATGHVIVLGKALGLLAAGASGDEGAFIIALQFSPIQARIAKYVSSPPSGKKYIPSDQPEMAKLDHGQIKIEKI